jgi:hypothetical protein
MFFGNSNFLQALGWAVLNSLWQMAFLWVVFQVILSFGINKPSAKGRLATVLLSTGFAWFIYTLTFHWLVDPDSIKRSLLAIGSFESGNNLWNEKLQLILPMLRRLFAAADRSGHPIHSQLQIRPGHSHNRFIKM